MLPTVLNVAFVVLYYGPIRGQITEQCKINHAYSVERGPGSSVGIVTDYGLDGPGSNPGGDEIFRPFRPALGLTQPPVKWVPGLSRG